MAKIVKMYLGNKDNLLKSWWDACQNENTSSIIVNAILYYNRTGDVLNIGNIVEHEMLPNTSKNIYMNVTSELEVILNTWKIEGKKESSEIKKILKRGITVCVHEEESHVISEIELDVAMEQSKGVQKVMYIPKEEPEQPQATPPAPNIKDNRDSFQRVHEEPETNSYDNHSKEKNEDDEKDFVLGMIAEGCGLGLS